MRTGVEILAPPYESIATKNLALVQKQAGWSALQMTYLKPDDEEVRRRPPWRHRAGRAIASPHFSGYERNHL